MKYENYNDFTEYACQKSRLVSGMRKIPKYSVLNFYITFSQ